MKSIYAVTFYHVTQHKYVISRYFQTIRAARHWAKRLAHESYTQEVLIYRGGQGGERVA